MPPWRTPEAGEQFTVKIIRLGDKFFRGNTMQDGHSEIAIIDGIEQALDEERVKDNLSGDAAVIGVNGGDIYIGGYSSALQLPVLGKEREARALSVRYLRKQNPDHNIIECERVPDFNLEPKGDFYSMK